MLPASASRFDPRSDHELDDSEVRGLTHHFKIDLDTRNVCVCIRPRVRIDDLPYTVHTNRELALMLAGTKPLAAFIGEYPPNPEVEDIPERKFEPYVRSGRFVKREVICPETGRDSRELGLRRVLYAQPDQQWRIDAYLLLWDTASKSGWNEGFERMEGTLLGYEDWQNDAYIEMSFGSKR